MNPTTILCATLLASIFAPALAEDFTPDQGNDGERRIVIRQGTITLPPGQQAALRAGDSASLTSTMLRISSSGIVKNAPYSAEAVSETMQRLADGNQIVTRSSSMQYRDSAGRTRTEVRGDDGKPRTITISDPVEGARWILNPERKSATRLSMQPQLARAAADAARAQAAQARVAAAQARAATQLQRKDGQLAPDSRVIVKEVQRDAEPTEVRVRVAQPMALAISNQIAPLIQGAINDGKWSAKAVTRELGERDIAGVRALGSGRSYAIPAGEIGNRDQIEVASETWYAPELQVTVYHKRSDPRSGDVVYRLEHLKRGEPAASLFAVPSDYTVRDPQKVSSNQGGKD